MENEYVMGIDPWKDAENTGSVCVIKRTGGEKVPDIIAIYTGRSKEDLQKEMERLIEFYKPLTIYEPVKIFKDDADQK